MHINDDTLTAATSNECSNALLFEHFPELYRPDIVKVTYRKQWSKFISAFSQLCLWVHSPYSKHKNGNGIVIYNSWWCKNLLNSHRWQFDVYAELEPYLTTNHTYSYTKNIAREWIPSENFIKRSIGLITDIRFDANPYWSRIIKTLIDEHGFGGYKESNIESGYIQLPVLSKIDKSNVPSYLIVKAYATSLLNGTPISYSVANTGRLHHPLQNLKKEARTKLFTDWYSYDFKACAPSILSQEYFKLVPNGSLPAIEMFIENRKEIRAAIAKQINVEEQTVKRVLTGLFFGQTVPSEKQALWDIEYVAKNSHKVDRFTFAVINTFGPEIAQKLLSNELFLSIVNECQTKVFKHLAYVLREKATTLENGSIQLVNQAGGIKTMNRWNSKQAVAHWYFGAERLAIDVVSSLLTEMNAQFLLIHDGFICNQLIDTKVFEQEILNKTGYNLEIVFQQEND
jgi:hypothetical protein